MLSQTIQEKKSQKGDVGKIDFIKWHLHSTQTTKQHTKASLYTAGASLTSEETSKV